MPSAVYLITATLHLLIPLYGFVNLIHQVYSYATSPKRYPHTFISSTSMQEVLHHGLCSKTTNLCRHQDRCQFLCPSLGVCLALSLTESSSHSPDWALSSSLEHKQAPVHETQRERLRGNRFGKLYTYLRKIVIIRIIGATEYQRWAWLSSWSKWSMYW